MKKTKKTICLVATIYGFIYLKTLTLKKNIVDHIGFRDDDKLSKLKQLYPQDASIDVKGGGEILNITADFLSNIYPTFKQLFEKTNRVKFNNLIQESFSESVKEYAGDQVEKILFDAILFKKIETDKNAGDPPKIKLLKLLIKHIDENRNSNPNLIADIETSIAKLIDKENIKKKAIEQLKNPENIVPTSYSGKLKKGGHRKTCFRKLSTRKRLRPSHFARSTKKVRCRKRATRKKTPNISQGNAS